MQIFTSILLLHIHDRACRGINNSNFICNILFRMSTKTLRQKWGKNENVMIYSHEVLQLWKLLHVSLWHLDVPTDGSTYTRPLSSLISCKECNNRNFSYVALLWVSEACWQVICCGVSWITKSFRLALLVSNDVGISIACKELPTAKQRTVNGNSVVNLNGLEQTCISTNLYQSSTCRERCQFKRVYHS